MEIQDYLTCLLRNLYAGKEATVKAYMERWTDSKLGKEYMKVVCFHPVYCLCSEYIMWNDGLDELQDEIKITRRNIDKLKYADDTR